VSSHLAESLPLRAVDVRQAALIARPFILPYDFISMKEGKNRYRIALKLLEERKIQKNFLKGINLLISSIIIDYKQPLIQRPYLSDNFILNCIMVETE